MDPMQRAALSRVRSALDVAMGGNPSALPGVEFAKLAGALASSKGDLLTARELLAHSPRLVGIIEKATVAAGGMSSPNWGAELPGYQEVAASFIESLRPISAFDQMLPSMRRAPLRTRLGVVSTAAAGSSTEEGVAKPVTKLALSGPTLDPLKATALVVITDELARLGDPAAIAMLQRELQGACSKATNTAFLGAITSGASTTACTGTAATNILADLKSLLALIALGETSRLFLVAPALSIARVALTLQAAGIGEIGAGGGPVAGIQFIPSDATPTTLTGSPLTATPTAILIDADGIVAGDDSIVLTGARSASIEMDTAPATRSTVTGSPLAPSASNTVNLFQSNARAVKAERWFGAERFRSSVAVLTGLTW